MSTAGCAWNDYPAPPKPNVGCNSYFGLALGYSWLLGAIIVFNHHRNHAGVRAGHTRRSRPRWAMASGRGRWPRRRETASYFRGARTGFQQYRGADARFRAGFALREAVLAREPAGRFAPEAGFSGQERSAGPRPWRGWTALDVHTTTTGATLPSGDCAGAAVSANHTWLPAPSRAPWVGEYRL